ncbi:hypothetical protein Q0590_09405 [Rhodocytophaga aerolata]|uniref:Secreted protein n=1 Tax=Rhodocytophaga aerolata TaxID=455078 RepID=A0ABT8R3F4_9BACT|nr:hypothetical protein [Rhodocytophaga aerolata]MDO1446464.1 hypothetical protein [Rhodocytophaga aerolata]
MIIKSIIIVLVSSIYRLCVRQYAQTGSIGINRQKQYAKEANEQNADGLKTEVVESETIQTEPRKVMWTGI